MDPACVLIVDADRASLLGQSEIVRTEMSGTVVETCDSAPEALQRIEDKDYDAILTDVRMPGMDGLELLARIRALRPETPTLLITGYDAQDWMLQALRGGAYDFLQKPIDRHYFVATLGRAIRTRQLSRQLEQQQQALAEHAA